MAKLEPLKAREFSDSPKSNFKGCLFNSEHHDVNGVIAQMYLIHDNLCLHRICQITLVMGFLMQRLNLRVRIQVVAVGISEGVGRSLSGLVAINVCRKNSNADRP